ncbi:hypothetical protein N7492_003585 [Penicillium capsulatum]|uniref:Uncharacterized protein n=1 Tax=Penicillium capsulatum TaxID=69766 RepID=A0A9W9INW9_9EURO|nr:hypothetical protein N7492_003585 [Penicillium capsulatum]KAJ6121832.1 hypothetical protein N7512_004297 [Penicillium capsulatum]
MGHGPNLSRVGNASSPWIVSMLRFRHFLQRQARAFAFKPGTRQAITAPSRAQHVRIRRPWLRSFVSKVFFYGVAFHVWSTLILSRFDDNEDTQDAGALPESDLDSTGQHSSPYGGNQLAEEEQEEEDAFFVPLTWSWLQEGEMYTASDPEWQEFVQISKDRQKLQGLRNELAKLVLKSAEHELSHILGGPLSLTGYWLVHQFPHRAPPEYMRYGLEFNDESIALVARTVHPEIGDRLQAFMKPMHVAVAIRDAYWFFFKRKFDRLTGQEVKMPGTAMVPGMDRVNPFSPHQAVPQETTETVPSNQPSEPSSFIFAPLQWVPLPDFGPGSDLHLASMVFRLRMDESKARQPRTPLRGTFFVAGPVGLKGPHGFCRFEVRGEYDPAKPGWRTVEMKLRDVNLRKQRPLPSRSQ